MNNETGSEQPSSTSNEINEDNVLSLMELFPQFSKHQLSQTLLAYDAVSYTHLDVYKRQLYVCVCGGC